MGLECERAECPTTRCIWPKCQKRSVRLRIWMRPHWWILGALVTFGLFFLSAYGMEVENPWIAIPALFLAIFSMEFWRPANR